MKRIGICAVFALLGVLFTVLDAQAREHIGFAALVKGDVKVAGIDALGDALTLEKGDKVFQGQRVLTGPSSKVQLIFRDDSIFTIGEDTEIVLDKYVYNPQTHEGTSVIEATKGLFKFITGKIAKKNPKEVKINTPFATVGVRGSGGIVEVLPGGETLLSVTDCCLDFGPRGAEQGVIQMNEVNVSSKITAKGALPSAPVPTPVEKLEVFKEVLGADAVPLAETQQTAPVQQTATTEETTTEETVATTEEAPVVEETTAVEGETTLSMEADAGTTTSGDPVTMDSAMQDKMMKTAPRVRKGFAAGFVNDSVDTYHTLLQSASTGAGTSGDPTNVQFSYDADGNLQRSITVEDLVTSGHTLSTDGGTLAYDSTAMSGVNNVQMQPCATCQFVSWGYWDTVASGGGVTIDSHVPFVVGDIAKDIGARGLTGNVTYNGITKGSLLDTGGNTVTQHSGTFSAGVDLGNRLVTNFEGTLDTGVTAYTFTGTGLLIAPTGDATFGDASLQLLENSTNSGGTAEINGALFGPSAEGIGGSFSFETGDTTLQGAGIFVGGQ